jgi:hypothetical protein
MNVRQTVRHTSQRVRRAMRAHRLTVALCVAIASALVLTGVSLTIYKVGGFYRYDLSRPGFEKERVEVSPTQTDVVYDTTSPLTKRAMDSFLSELDGRRKNLDAYNAFGSTALTDEDLQLTASQATATQ